MNGSNSNTSGNTVGTVTFGGKPECVSAAARAELQRDMIVTVKQDGTSDIWDKTTPPDDKTLIWWPKDPTSGVRLGQPRTYNAATGEWVEQGATPPYVPPEKRFGNDTVAAAVSQSKEITITPAMPEDDFIFYVIPTTQVGTTFNPASANMDNFGWEIIARVKNKVTLQFFNVPSGGLGFDWKAEEKK